MTATVGRILLALAVLIPSAVEGAPVVAEDERIGELVHGIWRGSALGREAQGGFLLLADPGGFVRCEIGRESSDGLENLLERRGQGWTVVAGPGGEGTRNAWDREWRPLEQRLAHLLLAGADLLAEAPEGEWRARRVVWETEEAPSLRRRLSARGRGRGGPGEILEARDKGDGWVALSSSRRPGSLRLGQFRKLSVVYPVRESFVPLWPLADLVSTETENPGTQGPRGR